MAVMDKPTVTVKVSKPRAKHVHEVLTRCKGGPMASPDRPSRQRQKQELRRALADLA
jgi:hypothetical protein